MLKGFGRFRCVVGGTREALGVALAVGVLVSVAAVPGSAQQAVSELTFTRDVAPILQENCQTCHRDGSFAPMPLTTYDEVRPFTPLIRHRVETREMPPWPMDHTIGIQEFKNDISLSDEEIATILGWIDSGAPMGDPDDMPPPVEWAAFEDDWQYAEHFGRPPDIVIVSPAYMVPANELDHWPNLETDVPGLTSNRWIRGVEIRPRDDPPPSRIASAICRFERWSSSIFSSTVSRAIRR